MTSDSKIDPANELAAETANDLFTSGIQIGDTRKNDVEALVGRYSSFSFEDPIDQGYERILVVKSDEWVPASGRSIKAGNLRFNLGTLFEAIASGVSTGFAAFTAPVVAVFTGLLAIRRLKKALEVDLSEFEALLIWATWMCEQYGEAPNIVAIVERCTQEAERVGSSRVPSTQEVKMGLTRLEHIGAIRNSGGGVWETIETIVVKT